jgi:hypothetical protein
MATSEMRTRLIAVQLQHETKYASFPSGAWTWDCSCGEHDAPDSWEGCRQKTREHWADVALAALATPSVASPQGQAKCQYPMCPQMCCAAPVGEPGRTPPLSASSGITTAFTGNSSVERSPLTIGEKGDFVITIPDGVVSAKDEYYTTIASRGLEIDCWNEQVKRLAAPPAQGAPTPQENEMSEAKGEFPKMCELCEKEIGSRIDLDWHGLGNCVPICKTCNGSGIAKTGEPKICYTPEQINLMLESARRQALGAPTPAGAELRSLTDEDLHELAEAIICDYGRAVDPATGDPKQWDLHVAGVERQIRVALAAQGAPGTRVLAERVVNALADNRWLNNVTAPGTIEIIALVEGVLAGAPGTREGLSDSER